MSRASRVLTLPSVGYRAMMISKSRFISKLRNGHENLPARADRAGDGAGDLGLAGNAVAVRNIHLPDAQATLDGFDLHLDVPAPSRVAHLQSLERLATKDAQRSQVPIWVTPQ